MNGQYLEYETQEQAWAKAEEEGRLRHPVGWANNEITNTVLENTFISIPYYNTNNGVYISDVTESYITKPFKHEGIENIGLVCPHCYGFQ